MVPFASLSSENMEKCSETFGESIWSSPFLSSFAACFICGELVLISRLLSFLELLFPKESAYMNIRLIPKYLSFLLE